MDMWHVYLSVCVDVLVCQFACAQQRWRTCVEMHACEFLLVFVYLYEYSAHMYMRTFYETCNPECFHACVCVSIYIYMCVCVCVYVYIFMYACIHVCLYSCMHVVHVCILVCSISEFFACSL